MHNRWHPDIAPVVTVAPGEALTLETEDGLAGQLTRESTHADCATLNLGLGHPLAGPVEIIGAKPGDVLEVEFLEYRSADFGVTAVIPGFGFLADRFTDPFLVKWKIDGDVAIRVGVARSSFGRAIPGHKCRAHFSSKAAASECRKCWIEALASAGSGEPRALGCVRQCCQPAACSCRFAGT